MEDTPMLDQKFITENAVPFPTLGVASLTQAEQDRVAALIYAADALIRAALDRCEVDGQQAGVDAALAGYGRFIDEHGEVGGVVFRDVLQLILWRARTQQPAV
jgi:hypothetical protein